MRVLILAAEFPAEMQPIAGLLAKELPESLVERVGNVRTAIHRIVSENRHPALLVVCQNWPDEYSRSDVNALFQVAPLARWICCYGSWCESDGRNRDTWPPGCRVPVRAFASRLKQEIEILKGERDPLPMTASRDEVFEFDSASRFEVGAKRLVLVESPDREWRRGVEAHVASAGHAVVDDCTPRGQAIADVVLRDLDPRQIDALATKDGEGNNRPGPAFIGLMGLPHPEDIAVARAAGYRTLLSKLAPIDLLLAAIAG